MAAWLEAVLLEGSADTLLSAECKQTILNPLNRSVVLCMRMHAMTNTSLPACTAGPGGFFDMSDDEDDLDEGFGFGGPAAAGRKGRGGAAAASGRPGPPGSAAKGGTKGGKAGGAGGGGFGSGRAFPGGGGGPPGRGRGGRRRRGGGRSGRASAFDGFPGGFPGGGFPGGGGSEMSASDLKMLTKMLEAEGGEEFKRMSEKVRIGGEVAAGLVAWHGVACLVAC